MNKENDLNLMNRALLEAHVYGEELKDACTVISGHFQFGRRDEGVALLKGLLEGIGCISQAIHLTQPIHREVGLEIELSELPGVLGPLVEAIENEDFGLVGDILSYEVTPVLDKWSQELKKAVH